jgi:preprotein translocase subunit SecG
MRFKLSNTLFVLSIIFFVVAMVLNYSKVKKDIEDTLTKARRKKSEYAKEKKRKKDEEVNEEINKEVIEILK